VYGRFAGTRPDPLGEELPPGQFAGTKPDPAGEELPPGQLAGVRADPMGDETLGFAGIGGADKPTARRAVKETIIAVKHTKDAKAKDSSAARAANLQQFRGPAVARTTVDMSEAPELAPAGTPYDPEHPDDDMTIEDQLNKINAEVREGWQRATATLSPGSKNVAFEYATKIQLMDHGFSLDDADAWVTQHMADITAASEGNSMDELVLPMTEMVDRMNMRTQLMPALPSDLSREAAEREYDRLKVITGWKELTQANRNRILVRMLLLAAAKPI